MASGESTPALRTGGVNEHSLALAREWKRLGRAATAVAVLTSPIVFAALISGFGWPWYWSLLAAFALIVVFRGAVDVLAHKLIPTPTIYGAEAELAEADVIGRRRTWYWRKKFRRLFFWGGLFLVVSIVVMIFQGEGLGDAMGEVLGAIPAALAAAPQLGLMLVVLFLINFLILFGPLVFLGIQEI